MVKSPLVMEAWDNTKQPAHQTLAELRWKRPPVSNLHSRPQVWSKLVLDGISLRVASPAQSDEDPSFSQVYHSFVFKISNNHTMTKIMIQGQLLR